MKVNILGYVLIALILIVSIKIYLESDYFNLKCIVSSVDGNTYCVRETSKLELAADKLARVTTNMKKLVVVCKEKYETRDNVQRLVKGFNPKQIYETLPTSEYTAYSQNKGEKIAFCLNEERDGKNLIDINTLTFVAIHELSHIASVSIGHTEEFWNNFKFLLQVAKENNLYSPVDYKKKPERYCGTTINKNPLYE